MHRRPHWTRSSLQHSNCRLNVRASAAANSLLRGSQHKSTESTTPRAAHKLDFGIRPLPQEEEEEEEEEEEDFPVNGIRPPPLHHESSKV